MDAFHRYNGFNRSLSLRTVNALTRLQRAIRARQRQHYLRQQRFHHRRFWRSYLRRHPSRIRRGVSR